MSKYGDMTVVEHNPQAPGGTGVAYNIRLCKPWDQTVADFADKNLVIGEGFCLNRMFVKGIWLVPNSIDAPSVEEPLKFPMLRAIDTPDGAA